MTLYYDVSKTEICHLHLDELCTSLVMTRFLSNL